MKQSFDPANGNFTLTFAADMALAQSSATTVIYLNEKLSYASGYNVSLVFVICHCWKVMFLLCRISPTECAKFVSRHNQVVVTADSKVIKDGQVGILWVGMCDVMIFYVHVQHITVNICRRKS